MLCIEVGGKGAPAGRSHFLVLRVKILFRIVAHSFRLPEFNGIAVWVMQAGKASVWIGLRIDGDIDASGTKLRCHGREIAHAEIDHPILLRMAKIIAVCREWSKDRRACLLRPRLLAVIRRRQRNAQMIPVPFGEERWILRAEEQAPDSSNVFHKFLVDSDMVR